MSLTQTQHQRWERDGYLVLPGLLGDDAIDAYCAAYQRAGVGPAGWPAGTPYLEVPELLDLCMTPFLVEALDELVGEPVALNLNLTGWVSTERKWHGDSYLSPDEVGERYIAAWMALDEISADAGPFECLPGSHRWPVLTRSDVFARLTPEDQADPDWPWFTESWVAEQWEDIRASEGIDPRPFLGSRGDVLVWHPNLIHRGSKPTRPGAERRAVIAHYSGARSDMPDVRQHGAGRYIAF